MQACPPQALRRYQPTGRISLGGPSAPADGAGHPVSDSTLHRGRPTRRGLSPPCTLPSPKLEVLGSAVRASGGACSLCPGFAAAPSPALSPSASAG
jgi:hypothetical protein